MFYLHLSNRTEKLLQELAGVLDENREDVFVQEHFLIQSQGMERYISQFLADQFGVFCNFQFHLPFAFLSHLADIFEHKLDADIFERETLVWKIESILRESSQFPELVHYLQGSQKELKRFQLARKLAHIFDQYQVLRPDMLDAWQKNKDIPGQQKGVLYINPAEHWQKAIWLRLLSDAGTDSHRGTLLQETAQLLKELGEGGELRIKRLFIIGLNTLPPLYLDVLRNLSEHIDIHLYLLSPSSRSTWTSSCHERNSGTLEFPLLQLLGDQGYQFNRILNESIPDLHRSVSFEEWKEPQKKLLHRLQNDLLHGEVPEFVGLEKDNSVRVVSCHSRLREMMVLKDHLLDMLYADTSLQLSDIVVMAPNIQQYTQYIQAVFHDIQHSVADRSMKKSNPVFSAFHDFLHLTGSDFGWRKVLNLLAQEAVFPAFGLDSADIEKLKSWVVQAGIRRGLPLNGDGDDNTDISFYPNTWKAGMDRLLLGFAMEGEDDVFGIFPCENIEGSDGEILGGLCEFIALVESFTMKTQNSRTLAQWSAACADLLPHLFGDDNSSDYLRLLGLFEDNKEKSRENEDIVFDVFMEWFDHSIREARSSSGFLRGQLTFCSMLPMRSIPFKTVCLVGLDNGEFPRKDQFTSFDLMGEEERIGDRSPIGDDRFQFLEAVLAAREILYLSYVGQSIRNNEKIEPSVVVTELLECIEQYYGVNDIVVHHPLQPFSHEYFAGHNALFSYSEKLSECARKIYAKELPDSNKGWWQGTLKRKEDEKTIVLSELLGFYKDPQKYFVTQILGLQLDAMEETISEKECFSSGWLDRYNCQQKIFSRLMAGEKLDGLLDKEIAVGSLPPFIKGKLEFEDWKQSVLQVREQLEPGEVVDSVAFELEISGCRVSGKITNIYENGVFLYFPGKLKAVHLIQGAFAFHVLSNAVESSLPVYMITPERVLSYSDANRPQVSCKKFVEYFLLYSAQIAPLFMEPGMAYVQQVERVRRNTTKRKLISPIESARKTFREEMDKSHRRELRLLFEGVEAGEVVGEQFAADCEELILPLWRQLNEEQRTA